MFKVNNRRTRRRSGVFIVDCGTFFCFFFMTFEHVNGRWNTLLPNFCHKELHLRCWIGLELNIVTSTKILKGIWGKHSPSHDLGKNVKNSHPPRCPKNTFPEVLFHLINLIKFI